MSLLLKATSIYHSFEYKLLSNIDFELNQGESKAIIGRSGSGKSTLLHIFSTFIKPKNGWVNLFGKDVYSMDNREIETIRRYNLGIIFQAHYLFKGMTALENLEVATLLSERSIDKKIIEKLEIGDNMSQKIGELSGGQQQRVSIARVLSKKPRIIFADEPTGNLDNETASLVMKVLLEYVEESRAGIVLVTHDENMAKLCNKIYKLENRRLEGVYKRV